MTKMQKQVIITTYDLKVLYINKGMTKNIFFYFGLDIPKDERTVLERAASK